MTLRTVAAFLVGCLIDPCEQECYKGSDYNRDTSQSGTLLGGERPKDYQAPGGAPGGGSASWGVALVRKTTRHSSRVRSLIKHSQT